LPYPNRLCLKFFEWKIKDKRFAGGRTRQRSRRIKSESEIVQLGEVMWEVEKRNG
jgi:hypothetical protein